MKKNNDSPHYKDWTTTKLKQEAKSLHYSIYVSESYGTRDIITLDGIIQELENRGLTMQLSVAFN